MYIDEVFGIMLKLPNEIIKYFLDIIEYEDVFSILNTNTIFSDLLSDKDIIIIRDKFLINFSHNRYFTLLGNVTEEYSGYPNGYKHGSYKLTKKSKVITLGKYFNNNKKGPWSEYNTIDNIVEFGDYHKNLRIGYWHAHDLQDTIYSGYYKDNIKIGLWTYYYKGRISQQGKYKNGKKYGVWKITPSLSPTIEVNY